VETLTRHLDQAEDLLDAIESALELSGVPGELWDTFKEIRKILEFAASARPLAERNLLGVLTASPASDSFEKLAAELDKRSAKLTQAVEKTRAWLEILTPEDTETALAQAQGCERSIFRFFLPTFWRLKRLLQARYDFSQHAIAPPWSKILGELSAR